MAILADNTLMTMKRRSEEEEVVYPPLPQEIWLQVLSDLPEADLACVALVSKQFAEMRKDARLWLDWTVSVQTIRRNEKRVLERLTTTKYLRSLTILGAEENFHLGKESGEGELPASILSALGRCCPHLTHLTILAAILNLDQLQPLIKGCPRLKTLTVENCFVRGSASVFYAFPKLRSLRIVTRKAAAAPTAAAAAPAYSG